MTSFRELHIPGKPFILANAWDAGSAKMLTNLGAKAIATTSAGHAFTLGRPDMGHVTREEVLTHSRELIDSTSLPVSGDLENGYGHDKQDVVETVRLAGEAGLAGACIEDTSLPTTTPYEFAQAVERIEAGVEAARALPQDFVLVARADGYMNGEYDLDESLKRAKAFEIAGADVIYIPMLQSISEVAQVCREINVPVNILCAGKLRNRSLSDFASAGAARISLGSLLASVTHQAILDSSKQMFEQGEFGLLNNAANGDEIDQLLK